MPNRTCRHPPSEGKLKLIGFRFNFYGELQFLHYLSVKILQRYYRKYHAFGIHLKKELFQLRLLSAQ